MDAVATAPVRSVDMDTLAWVSCLRSRGRGALAIAGSEAVLNVMIYGLLAC